MIAVFAPAAWRGLVPESFDVDVFQRFELPLEPIGLAWSEMISVGVKLQQQVPAERVLHVRYESMLQAPQEELRRIVRFMDPSLDDAVWLGQAATRVRKNPPKWVNLDADARARLELACAPGMAPLSQLA